MAKNETGRTRELRILNAVAEALNSAPDVRRAMTNTLRLVADLLGLKTGWVWLADPDTQAFYNVAALNLPPYLQEPVRMTGKSCWCIDGFRAGDLKAGNIDMLYCSRLGAAVKASDLKATSGLRCHASIPLYFQDKPLGIMNVAAPQWRELTPDELRLLETIAYQVGIAVERARLAEDSARLARSEERARLAREIHDTLAQGLTAIALHIEGAMNQLERDPARARERLDRALSMTRESLEEARRSVHDLRAAPLAGRPLAEALGALARTFAAETGIRAPVRILGGHGLPLRVEAELYRIAQEALTNVRRHAAGANEVTLVLRTTPDTAHLVVRDNGGGFARESVPDGGQGLVGMRERARLLRGRLRLLSRLGRGTTVSALVPISQGDAP